MKSPVQTRAFAPVTLANLAVGFDVLGLAAQPLDGSLWGDVVTVRDAPDQSEPFRVSTAGPYGADLPRDPASNVVHAVVERFLATRRVSADRASPVEVVLEKNLPVSSGLGGSASSAVAALVAINHHLGEPLSREDLLPMAGQAERFTSGAEHYDNVAPALLGGVCLLRGSGAEGVVRLPWPKDWVLAFVTPEFPISTRESRKVLPQEVPLSATIRYGRNLALFIAALFRSDLDLARSCLDDTLVEPVRGPLLPGFLEAKAAALTRKAIGCSLSGSGPTTFALAPDAMTAERIAHGMIDAFSGAGLRATWRLARVDMRGARVLAGGSA